MFVLVMLAVLGANIQKGDSFFFAMNYDSAKVYYMNALKEDSLNYEVHWRVARLYCNIGDVLSKKDSIKAMYDRAFKHAEKAINIDSTRYEGYLWKAAAAGDKALFLGGKKKVEFAFIVKNNAEKAIEIKPDCAYGYFILGEYQREAATLGALLRRVAKTLFGKVPEGSLDSSRILLTKAISLDTTEVKFFVGRGKTYKAMKKYALARKDFKRALTIKDKYLIDRKLKDIARKYLKKLK